MKPISACRTRGLAAALGFGAAAAAEPPADRSPVATHSVIPSEPKADCATEESEETDLVEIMVGGVRDPREAEWDHAGNLPEIPLAGPDAFTDEAGFVEPPAVEPE